MAQSIRDMEDRELSELIAAAARSASQWSFDGAAAIIDAAGAELMRRQARRNRTGG